MDGESSSKVEQEERNEDYNEKVKDTISDTMDGGAAQQKDSVDIELDISKEKETLNMSKLEDEEVENIMVKGSSSDNDDASIPPRSNDDEEVQSCDITEDVSEVKDMVDCAGSVDAGIDIQKVDNIEAEKVDNIEGEKVDNIEAEKVDNIEAEEVDHIEAEKGDKSDVEKVVEDVNIEVENEDLVEKMETSEDKESFDKKSDGVCDKIETENNNEMDLTDIDISSYSAKAVDDLKEVQDEAAEFLAEISQGEDEEDVEEDLGAGGGSPIMTAAMTEGGATNQSVLQYKGGNSDKIRSSRGGGIGTSGGSGGGDVKGIREEEQREAVVEEEEEEEEELVRDDMESTPHRRGRKHPLSPLEEEEENFMAAAICTAAEEGNLDAIHSLLEEAANFDITTPNKHGECALHTASGGGHQHVIDFLLTKGQTLTQVDRNGDNALIWAARQGHVDIVDFFVQNDLPLNAQNKNGETALHLAARYGQTAVIEYLCKAKANVNLQDKLGETVLHIAAWHDLPPNFVAMLCTGKVDTQNQDGETALLCAASRGNMECVRCLLAHQANINTQDKRGCTPLHLCTRRRHVGISLLLLHQGAHMDVVDQLNETPLHAACREGLLPIVQTMCAFGADVEIVSKAGHSPLHIVARSGHIEVARCLLLSGAEPDLPNKDGTTAEIVALAQGNQDVAELLSKLRPERRDTCIKQLTPVNKPLSRIKMKIFGNSGVGKSTLIESLKCGYFGSFFRKARLTTSNSVQGPRPKGTENGSNGGGGGGLERQHSLPTQLSYDVVHEQYTKGIDVQQISITGAGELSVWEFSGYEPYYMLYDHFIGDPNCLHMVVFRADVAVEVQVAQVSFWLSFIKARMAPMEPIGECGRQPWPAKVLLVATHVDCIPEGEETTNVAAEALQHAKKTHWADFDIVDHVYVVDAHLAMAPELKLLRNQLGEAKTRIVKNLPHSKGFVDAVVTALPAWRKVMGSFPVVTWPSFIEYVRAKVNLLASEEHMKEVMCQLQLLGEVIYVETESEKDLVVLCPRWLCSEVLGEMLSHERITHTRPTGCFSADDFQIMFPESESQDLLPLLEALDLCVQCDIDGDIEYEFPCFNFVETLNGLWEREDRRLQNAVYGGVRFVCGAGMKKQLVHMFPRLQVALRRDVIQDTNGPDSDLYQWYHGSKYCSGSMEAIVTLEHNDQVIDLKCRGPPDHRAALCYFLEELCELLEDVLDDSCPGIGLLRNPLSVSQLKDHKKDVHAYSRHEVLSAQLEGSNSLMFSADQAEELKDLLAFGSQEILDTWTLGIDLHISHLPIGARRKLSEMLDPTDPMGRDWCMLAVTVGLTEQLPQLDHENSQTFRSRSDRTMERWARHPDANVRALVTKLQGFGRTDAADVILHTAAIYKFPDNSKIQQPSSHESENTLASSSSVSR